MKFLKSIIQCSFLLALAVAMSVNVNAQDDKSSRKSPAMEATGMVGDVQVSINYGAPSVKDREIWGSLVPYDEVWRTGANEATTFEVSKNVLIEGQELAAGKYSLFTIPGKEKWTLVFNSEPDQWGSYNYDKSKDVLRVDVTPKMTDEPTEMLTFKVKEKDGSSYVAMKWDKMKVTFAVAPVASN